MNHTETIELTRYVQALCPAQKLDQYSADAWHDVLGDLPLGVAKKAAASCARLKPFVAPSEIIGAAFRLRRAVCAQVERETEETDAPQDGHAYVAWRRRRVAEIRAEADRRIGGNVYDLSRVDVSGDVYAESEPVALDRIDGRPAIEARRIEDEPTVPLAEVLEKARAIRDASREPQSETEPAA
jgi:hypothetical protein